MNLDKNKILLEIEKIYNTLLSAGFGIAHDTCDS